jgi:regulator of RNase E activity RraA
MKIVASHTVVMLRGVIINHGDLIIADDDGVVAIPRDVEVKVITLARTRAADENLVLHELLGGKSLRSVWDTYRIL